MTDVKIVQLRGAKKLTQTDQAIGAKIRKLRRRLELTLKDLSELIGISVQQLQKYEVGSSRIGGGMLVQLAGALNVDIASLFPNITIQTGELDSGKLNKEDLIQDLVKAASKLKDDELRALLTLASVLGSQ